MAELGEATQGSEPARLSEGVLQLGQLISAALGRNQADVMSHWIGARIAELMDLSENGPTAEARLEAASQCQDLILAVWERRNTWGSAWPPRGLDQIVHALQRDGSIFELRRGTTKNPPLTWTDAVAAALISLDRERDVWLAMAARESPAEEVDTWIRVLNQVERLIGLDRPAGSKAESEDSTDDSDLDSGQQPDERDALKALSALIERANRSTRSRARTRGAGTQPERDAAQQLGALWRERRSWLKSIENGQL